MKAVKNPNTVNATMMIAQNNIGNGFFATQTRLSNMAVIASLLRSSINGTATTLIEKMKLAKPLPMTR